MEFVSVPAVVIKKYSGCILASPEPLVITSKSFRFGCVYSVHIFTCIDGELRHITDESGESLFSWYGDLEYQQFTGYFIDKYVHQETISNPIYCLKNDKAELIKDIESIDVYINGSRVVTYSIDGTEVSEAEYNEVFNSWNIDNGSVWSYAQFFSVTDSNISTYIES